MFIASKSVPNLLTIELDFKLFAKQSDRSNFSGIGKFLCIITFGKGTCKIEFPDASNKTKNFVKLSTVFVVSNGEFPSERFEVAYKDALR